MAKETNGVITWKQLSLVLGVLTGIVIFFSLVFIPRSEMSGYVTKVELEKCLAEIKDAVKEAKNVDEKHHIEVVSGIERLTSSIEKVNSTILRLHSNGGD
jgi:hypothetical protein